MVGWLFFALVRSVIIHLLSHTAGTARNSGEGNVVLGGYFPLLFLVCALTAFSVGDISEIHNLLSLLLTPSLCFLFDCPLYLEVFLRLLMVAVYSRLFRRVLREFSGLPPYAKRPLDSYY